MHIPERYLSPQTWGAAYAVMIPIWVIAGRRLRRGLSARRVPLLAIGAAFSFTVMMFNIPAFGYTGHVTGAPLIAILLGSWAAVMAISVVLVVQAFMFGDGGITAIGANCFAMAFLMPFVSYATYQLVSWKAPIKSHRRIIAAALAGYVGINIAALAVAVLLGIQPMIAHSADGRPLYFPLPLSVTVPAIALGHLLAFGIAEGAVTAAAVAYLARTEPELLGQEAISGPTVLGQGPAA